MPDDDKQDIIDTICRVKTQKTTCLFHKWIEKVLNFKEVYLLTLSYSAKYNKNLGLLLHIKTLLTGSEYK